MTCETRGWFFFNDTATTEIYTLSLHDALPIFRERRGRRERWQGDRRQAREDRQGTGMEGRMSAPLITEAAKSRMRRDGRDMSCSKLNAPIRRAVACSLLGLGLALGVSGCAPWPPHRALVEARRPPPPRPASSDEPPRDEPRFVDSVLARLTLAEKVGQLNQLSGLGDPTGPGGTAARADQIRRGEIGSFLNVVGAHSPPTAHGA